jgi:hypothetical protein
MSSKFLMNIVVIQSGSSRVNYKSYLQNFLDRLNNFSSPLVKYANIQMLVSKVIYEF